MYSAKNSVTYGKSYIRICIIMYRGSDRWWEFQRHFWVVSSLPYFLDHATFVEILVWTFSTQSEFHVLVIFMRVVLPSKKNFGMCGDNFDLSQGRRGVLLMHSG